MKLIMCLPDDLFVVVKSSLHHECYSDLFVHVLIVFIPD